jgi:hypothetical protein
MENDSYAENTPCWTPSSSRFLTIEEVVGRICSGKPVTWLTVHSGSETYDVAIARGCGSPAAMMIQAEKIQ